MLIIKVNATDSTNLHLRRMLEETELPDLSILVAVSQNKGRGQAGTRWSSEAGSNLTLSVLKRYQILKADQGFRISMAVSLALTGVLKELEIPDVSIKWPNDIMSGHRKICGILIENTLKGSRLDHSIIGIGINVNQEAFEGLPHAASLLQITGKTYDLDSVLDLLLAQLGEKLQEPESTLTGDMRSAYVELLFLKGIQAPFRLNGKEVLGTIRGVSDQGRLLLEEEGGILHSCDLKEITYIL